MYAFITILRSESEEDILRSESEEDILRSEVAVLFFCGLTGKEWTPQ